MIVMVLSLRGSAELHRNSIANKRFDLGQMLITVSLQPSALTSKSLLATPALLISINMCSKLQCGLTANLMTKRPCFVGSFSLSATLPQLMHPVAFNTASIQVRLKSRQGMRLALAAAASPPRLSLQSIRYASFHRPPSSKGKGTRSSKDVGHSARSDEDNTHQSAPPTHHQRLSENRVH